jgi:hypothetical protein
MARITVNRESHICFVEESWWEADVEGRTVAVHARVYRCDWGPHLGEFGAEAHIHWERGGAHLMKSAGMPAVSRLDWEKTREAAVDRALEKLETRDDHVPR